MIGAHDDEDIADCMNFDLYLLCTKRFSILPIIT